MPTRNATATWEGGIKGKGSFKGESGAIDAGYSFGSRFENAGGSNPEELLAAADAACYSMALSLGLERILVGDDVAVRVTPTFDGAPEGVAQAVQSEVGRRVEGAVGRHTELEMVALGVRSLAAVADILGEKPYLFGRRPCGADATVWGPLVERGLALAGGAKDLLWARLALLRDHFG